MKESGNEIIYFYLWPLHLYIIHELLDHRLKQLNIGRSCWTQVEVTGLKVETADFYVEVSLLLYFNLYHICIARCGGSMICFIKEGKEKLLIAFWRMETGGKKIQKKWLLCAMRRIYIFICIYLQYLFYIDTGP